MRLLVDARDCPVEEVPEPPSAMSSMRDRSACALASASAMTASSTSAEGWDGHVHLNDFVEVRSSVVELAFGDRALHAAALIAHHVDHAR